MLILATEGDGNEPGYRRADQESLHVDFEDGLLEERGLFLDVFHRSVPSMCDAPDINLIIATNYSQKAISAAPQGGPRYPLALLLHPCPSSVWDQLCREDHGLPRFIFHLKKT